MASLRALSTRISSCAWRSAVCSWAMPPPPSSIAVSMLICKRCSWGAHRSLLTRRHRAAVDAARSKACPDDTARVHESHAKAFEYRLTDPLQIDLACKSLSAIVQPPHLLKYTSLQQTSAEKAISRQIWHT